MSSTMKKPAITPTTSEENGPRAILRRRPARRTRERLVWRPAEPRRAREHLPETFLSVEVDLDAGEFELLDAAFDELDFDAGRLLGLGEGCRSARGRLDIDRDHWDAC